jgi:hypothetical protein
LSYIKEFHMDGHVVRAEFNELNSNVKVGLENAIGKAKRKANRDYSPGNAFLAVLAHGVERISVDGHDVQWRNAKEEIPALWDDEHDCDLVDRLIGEVLKQRYAQRLLLRKPEYREVFEDYILHETEEVADLNPTESPAP